MTQHSELGASSCSRWWNCPGSVRLSRGIESRSSEYAREGTAAHALAAGCLISEQDAAEYVDRAFVFNDHGQTDSWLVDAEMADAVQVYLDECRSVFEHTLPDNRFVEQSFDLSSLAPPAPMFGTADFVAHITGWRELHVYDLKYGRGVRVEAEGNPQLRYYALGALLTLGVSDVRRVVAKIIQPRAGGVSTTTIDVADLTGWALDLLGRAAATQDPGAPLNPGPWCRFCPAAGSCPAQAAKALQVAQIEFGSVRTAVPPPAETLTNEQIAGILSRAPEFRTWLDSVVEVATVRARAGDTVPGWKLVDTFGRDAWRDESELNVLADLYQINVDAPRKYASPAQIRGTLAGLSTAKTKKEREAEAKAILAPLLHKPHTGTALVPDTDARPAIATGGAEFATAPVAITEGTD